MLKKLKKLFMVLLVVPAMFVFGACKNNDGSDNDGGTPSVVTPPGQGGGQTPSNPDNGGDVQAPDAQTYVVSVEYGLPEGYEVLQNYSVTKNVGESIALPAIADENLKQFFLGWFDKSTNEPIDGETLTGTSGQTISIFAKWNETTLKNYYYTPGLAFALGTDLNDETIAVVDGYDGISTNVILPKFYEFEAGVIWPVRMIAQNCFNNSNIESLKYSSNGLIVGKNAFANTNITSFDFSNVLYVDEYAFYGSKLESVEIGALTQGIGAFAFYDCEELTTVDFSNVSLFNKLPVSCFENCKKLENVELSSAIKTISSAAFVGCVTLENIEFLQNVEVVEQQAFKGCTAITSVVVYEGIKTLSGSAFEGCNIENLSVYNLFDDSDLSRFSTTFGGLSSAKNLTLLGDGITQIRQYYFADVDTLESISIANSVQTIGQYAFSGCVKLETIQFPENLDISTFKTNAIQDTAWYQGLTDVTYIGSALFYVPASVSGAVEIQSGTTSIVSSAFKNNTNITSVKIPASLKIMSASVFENCTSLESVEFAVGSQVTQIASKAFKKCTSLVSINLDVCELLSSIGASAFDSAGSNITELKLPNNIATIDSSAFLGAKIASYAIDDSANNFAVQDGVLFNKQMTTLCFYPSRKNGDVYIVPSTVSFIQNYAFSYNTFINVVQLQSAVSFEDIGGISYSFYQMSQNIYLIANDQSVTIKSVLSNLIVCYQLTETDIEYTAQDVEEETVISFAIKEDSTYEFVTGKYFIKINVNETDMWFLLDISVSGETITINSANDISSYFA